MSKTILIHNFRDQFKKETGEEFHISIGKYADWLENKLSISYSRDAKIEKAVNALKSFQGKYAMIAIFQDDINDLIEMLTKDSSDERFLQILETNKDAMITARDENMSTDEIFETDNMYEAVISLYDDLIVLYTNFISK